MANVPGSKYDDTILVNGGSFWKFGKKTGSIDSSSDFADVINTGNGHDLIYGGGGNDVISAGNGVDTVHGGDGDDKIWGDAQSALDTANGGDVLFGEAGDDTIYGGNGKDSISGGADNDVLFGDNGDDTINGDAGNDTIYGGNGGDTLHGGTGADRFVYQQNTDSPVNGGWDRIYDFSGYEGGSGEGDKIDLTAFREGDDLEWRGDLGPGAWGVWYEAGGIGYYIFADTNGDGVADIRIEMDSLPGAGDFLGVKTPPILTTSDDAGNVTEDTPNDAAVTLNDAGSIGFYDGDISNPHTVDVTDDGGNTLGGTLSVSLNDADGTGNGSVDWTYEVDNANVQYLGAGDTATESFTVTITDSTSLTVEEVVTVTVTGVNDDATITAEDGGDYAAQEDTDSGAGGTLDVNDVDQGESSFASTDTGTQDGQYGTFTFDASTGVWSYGLDDTDPDTQALGGTATDTEVFTVHSDDGTAFDVTVTVQGDNDAATIGETSGEHALVEAGGVGNGTTGDSTAGGTLTVTDVDTGESSFKSGFDGTSSYGTFSFNESTGEWSYSLSDSDTDTQGLTAGETATETFTVHSADDTPYDVVVTITGANDVPSFSDNSSDHSVTEDNTLDTTAGGTLSVTDVDDGQSSFTGYSGTNSYGSFSFNTGTGAWLYTINNADPDFDTLGSGQSATETLTVTSADGTTYTVSVTVNGADDIAPSDPNDFDIAGSGPTTAVTKSDPSQATAQMFWGTTTADTINAGGDSDTIYGYGGNDAINGETGDDWLYGGTGNDTLSGQGGADTIYGGSGDDVIYGYTSGSNGTVGIPDAGDKLFGGSGNDSIVGNDGNDTIIGGYGNDTMTGGAGSDTFQFLSLSDGTDRITDFTHGTDKLDLANLYGGTLTWGGTTATANGVWYAEGGGDTTVYVDVTGDATADLTIVLTGTGKNLDASDFVL